MFLSTSFLLEKAKCHRKEDKQAFQVSTQQIIHSQPDSHLTSFSVSISCQQKGQMGYWGAALHVCSGASPLTPTPTGILQYISIVMVST